MMLVDLLVLSLLTPAFCLLDQIGLKQIDSNARVFYEIETRREIIFHGVNAIVKGFPWVPSTTDFDIDTSLVDKDHEMLADLGVNMYRLGSMWPGVEPNRGKYNITYLTEMNKIIDASAKYGIYTLLDMHQDVLSEKYCGEGVPAWAAESFLPRDDAKFPAPIDTPYQDVADDGFPTRQDCGLHGWAQYYNTRATADAFESLYTNRTNLLSAWGEMWRTFARVLGSPNLLGYELINEPYAGNIFKEPTLLIPGHADKNRLQPAYDELVKYIREVDQDRLVFFAGVTWDDVVPVGFTSVPGGDSEAGRSVFAFHFYEPPQTNDVTYFHQRMKDATRLQSGFMLTEFERPGNDADFIDDPFIVTTDEADKHLVSWSCWEYKTFCKETDKTSSSNSQAADFGSCKTGYGEHLWWDDNGNQNMVASRKLARTYAQKTAGRAKHMSFNATSADFEFKFVIDTTIVEPTEIFAHQRLQYPGGMKVTITPETSRLTWKMLSTNIIGVFPSSKTTNGETVTVKISNRT